MNTIRQHWSVILFVILCLATGCTPLTLSSTPTTLTIDHYAYMPLDVDDCAGHFIPHPLDHITAIDGDVVRTFDSNGAGLAVNDLDRDGDLDLVMANLAGANAIFWNEGALKFRKQPFPHGQSRAVSIVDIDGDGWQDIVFAHRETRPWVWMNQGEFNPAEGEHPRSTGHIDGFTRLDWFSASQRAYTFAWADLDGDIDLDLVLATYQTEYTRVDPTDLSGGGVVYYENTGEYFTPTHLATHSQALALMLVDLNGDGHLDIWVGHDFLMPDQVWLWQEGETGIAWVEAMPFDVTAQNTMSFAVGDLNNNGQIELFAADMKPYEMSDAGIVAWSPLMETMTDIDTDQQIIENVLLVPAGDKSPYENQATVRGIDATGWSWSAQFGDLDQDGYLDLYVVNGMAAEEIFGHLPNQTLKEENLVFRNDGQGNFVVMSEWGLNTLDGGRGMTMADLDNDGDLDIIVNNLLSRAVVYENQLCMGSSLSVDLRWPQSMNTDAIGARLTLKTTTGAYQREIRSNSGYLSGETSRVHFGLPTHSQPIALEILWPDGMQSTLLAPRVGGRLVVMR